MGRRKKSNLNRKLNKILLFMTALLIVLIAITYVDSKILNNKANDNSSSITDPQNNTNPSDDNNIPLEDTSTDSPGSPQAGDRSDEKDEPQADDIVDIEEPLPAKPIVLAFAGDVNFDEDSKPVARYDRENKGILGGISEDLVNEMNEADIFMLNNEFAYSTRGREIIEKSYTFRADPKRVEILKEMGVDIVSLANNHALDFREEALLDTFTTLDEAGVDYVGAGVNMNRAKAPIYYTIGDTTIAYVAASHVIYAMDWYATDTRPGMIGTYDPALFVTSIKEAKENSDFVVVYVHWGKERTHEPVSYQKNLAKIYIDAGADAVIGCHPHVMQGIEFYKGKTIAYSLGNYWFNASKRESGLLKIYINPDGSTETQLLPAMNDNTYTYMITEGDARESYFKFMEDISFNVKFDEKGFVSEK
ncbi:MAG: CapA family protein [Anaerolineaceae bacterium]|nr:MAG: CapA family protein [Anaerolineaceae bacterium]